MKKPLITEIDNVETKRVLAVITKAKFMLNALTIVVLGFSMPFIIKIFSSANPTGAYVLLVLAALVYFGITISIHATYSPMLETAKLNDKIRHEEKVRTIERDKHDLEKEIESLKLQLERASQQSKNIM